MFGKVSRYDEHPARRSAYYDVIGRSATPHALPLSAERSGSAHWRIVIPLFLIFFGVTWASLHLAPQMFLGWLTHGICFILLGIILYRLCPPHWVERVEVTSEEVHFERLGVTGYRIECVPLAQYRGIIPVTHQGMDDTGSPIKEYGVALRHADPTKTVILALSPIQHDGLVEHYAELLTVKPIYEEKFSLRLKTKRIS